MAGPEYNFVESPMLTQLHNLGWKVYDQGVGVPKDPAKSLRNSFKEVVLKQVFIDAIKDINKTEDNQNWLTDMQAEEMLRAITFSTSTPLFEANKKCFEILTQKEKTTVDKNNLTGEKYPTVKFIDFEHPEKNSFIAINQFRIDTPGFAKDFIIPDVVLFVNGLPLCVVECKYPNEFTANPMEEAINQLFRYINKRDTDINEGDERLFHYNQFSIATWGDEARESSITGDYEDFMEWKDIYPVKYQDFEAPLGKVRSQEKLVQGMLVPETLLDIVKHFILFDGSAKVVARYQQYRAVIRTVDRIMNGKTSNERSGVVWHTQGSGKSFTMVFLVRKIRSEDKLKGSKIIVVNDRTDLEEQLTETMLLTGETVDVVNNTDELKSKGETDTSNLLMAMVHKFLEREKEQSELLKKTLSREIAQNTVAINKPFDVVNDSEKVIVLIDEAHRTQNSTMGMNITNAFPNSSKIGFTGTPLISERNKKTTKEVFGGSAYIDTYKLRDAVDDGATVKILFEGKTAETAINDRAGFDAKFEDLFSDKTEEEMVAIKKKYGTLGDIFECENRIQAISNDIVNHYVENILPNGFKAQVVASSKPAAIRYKRAIEKAINNRLEQEIQKTVQDLDLIKKLSFLKTIVIISSDGTNEPAEFIVERKRSKELGGRESFKQDFDYSKEKTGVAILVVCDMLLTGFDAKVEQVLYVDKKMVEHNLLQAIARVNRKKKGKDAGYVVDYIGIGNHLYDALQMYDKQDEDDTIGAMQNIDYEIPVLHDRYLRLINLFKTAKINRIEDYVTGNITDPVTQYSILEECITALENIKLRADFSVYLKQFLISMDIIMPNIAAKDYTVPAKVFGHIHNRTMQRYKDTTINIMGAGGKVKKLINQHLVSLGIDPKLPPTDLLSPEFKKLVKETTPANKKATASEMAHAARKHCKVNMETDPILYQRLSEKLQNIIDLYENDVDEKYEQLKLIIDEIYAGRKNNGKYKDLNETDEIPFCELILQTGFSTINVSTEVLDIIIPVTRKIVEVIKRYSSINDFWTLKSDLQKKMRQEIKQVLWDVDMDEILDNDEAILTEIYALGKKKYF